MKSKKFILEELSEKFGRLSQNEITLFNEIVLILNLRRYSGNYSDPELIFRQIELMRGNCVLADWNSIIEDLREYANSNPLQKGLEETDMHYPFRYVKELVSRTSLGDEMFFLNHDVLFNKVRGMLDSENLYHYMCYVYLKRYLVTNAGNVHVEFFEFAEFLLYRLGNVYPYIPAWEILDIDLDNYDTIHYLRDFQKSAEILKTHFSDDVVYGDFMRDLTGFPIEDFRAKIRELDERCRKRFEEDELKNRLIR